MDFGILTIVPLVLMVVLVMTTKRVLESMIFPLLMVFIMKDGTGFLFGFMDSFYDVMAEGTFPWVMFCISMFGALIALLIASGAIDGFKRLAVRYIKSEKSSMVFTWILGLIICIDDYINDLAIGPTVRKITDANGVPREGIGIVILSLGVPICTLLPVTAMAAFVFGIMQDNGISSEDSILLTEYAKLLPFMAFPVFIALITLLLALGVLPKFGPLKKAFAESRENLGEVEMEEVKGGNLIDFIIPVIVLLLMVLIFHELIIATLAAIAACFIMYIPRKIMTLSEFFENFNEGIKDMVEIVVILLAVFIFVNGLEGIGLSEYVISTVSPVLVGGVIPVLSFIVVALLVFGGMDYWAGMVLIAPIIIPLAQTFDVNVYLTMAAAVSGSVCGGNACFFGEQMLLVSEAVELPPSKLGYANLPYAIIAAVATAIFYLVMGFVL